MGTYNSSKESTTKCLLNCGRGTQNRTGVNRESQVANSVIEAANRNRIVPVCQNALYEQMRARNMVYAMGA